MKVVVLAGGLGTRLAEETEVRPKPMVEIGGRPILWHILKHFDRFGLSEFVVAAGYKSEIIKRFFLDYCSLSGNLSIDLKTSKVERHLSTSENWIIHVIETGLNTCTGGRIKRLKSWVRNQPFILTYGDAVADVNVESLIKAHRSNGKIATVTAVRPPARFGGLAFQGDLVTEFIEKPQIGEGWINGGYMIFEPRVFDFLLGDETRLEQDVLEQLARLGQLAAFRHEGFWQCMDTIRDLQLLRRMWDSGKAPWRVWDTQSEGGQ